MKKLLLLLFVGILISCSKDDSPSNEKIIIPETYNVKYEILGTGKVNFIEYSTSVEETKRETLVSLPFRKSLTHKNRKEGLAYEDYQKIHHQILLKAYEHYSTEGEVLEVNIYIDGKLANTKLSKGMLQNQLYLWFCDFSYVIRGRD